MEQDEVEVRRRRPVKRLTAIGVLLLVLLLAVIVWTQRTELATDAIRRELERRGVRATYQVTRIGFRTQRLENLVIGDPARPDLTARFVEVRLPVVSLLNPDIQRITARGVRLFGRVVDGKVSFGEVDRLLPPRTGAPFRFPDQNIDVADAAMALDTPAGRVAFGIEGRGNLANGFRGEMSMLAPTLLVSGCAIDQPVGYAKVAITNRRPTIDGPFQADRLLCANDGVDIAQPLVDVELTVPETLDSWIGRASLEADRAQLGGSATGAVRGRVSFRGNSDQTTGAVALAARNVQASGAAAAQASIDGNYAYSNDRGQLSLIGDGAAGGIDARATLSPVARALASADGTPVDPIGDALAAAVTRFGSGFDARGSLRLVNGPGSGAVRVERLSAASRSGARLALDGGEGMTYYWPAGIVRADGEFGLSGGGFPATRLSLNQPRGGAPISGEARIAPMAAGGARLTLAPVRFSAAAGGTTRIETTAVIDGPFNDGRVAGLVVPVNGRFGSSGGFAFGESCTTIGFRGLEVADLRLGPTRLPLCPTGRALVWRNPGGEVQAAAEIRSPRLAGRLGQSPLTIAADRAGFSLAQSGFTSSGVEIRLDAASGEHRLDIATLGGRFNDRGVTGSFAGGSGKLANVPLLLSEARGEWSVLGGDLAVNGALTVADAVEPARFYPLAANEFRLTLADGEIDAGGWLTDPQTGTRVTEVTIDHDLSEGLGQALLDVPGIRFDDSYQPEELTRLTTGVVALVDGTLTGQGRINWGPSGTTSTGTFSTENMNLAAPFGPVTGLTTTIEFTDLLGLTSAPGQVAQVGRIQAGIDVLDGLVRYQLLPDQRVRVESGRWPFAGGELFLEETILDFSQPSTKALTFRVAGLDAAIFVADMEFANIAATGIFDGIVPMEFDERGGRIVNGRLEARSQGTLSYVGEVSDAALGTYGKLAFDALKSLTYSKFIIGLNGELAGEFLANIELDGLARNTPDPGGIAGALIGQLKKIPFEFNIAIRGPLRALIGTARSFEDPSLLIQPVLPAELRDLPTTVVEEDRSESETVQPQESEIVQ